MTRYLPSVPLQPAPAPITHDVTIVTTRKSAQARVMGVPPEEFEIERGARSIRDRNYCFHEVVTKTEAQLIAERAAKSAPTRWITISAICTRTCRPKTAGHAPSRPMSPTGHIDKRGISSLSNVTRARRRRTRQLQLTASLRA
jgi:hypothetical protein